MVCLSFFRAVVCATGGLFHGLLFRPQDFPLNPKALSLGELYGEFDLNTNEWTDGVLSSVMRTTCAGGCGPVKTSAHLPVRLVSHVRTNNWRQSFQRNFCECADAMGFEWD